MGGGVMGLYKMNGSPYWWMDFTRGDGERVRHSTKIRVADEGSREHAETILEISKECECRRVFTVGHRKGWKKCRTIGEGKRNPLNYRGSPIALIIPECHGKRWGGNTHDFIQRALEECGIFTERCRNVDLDFFAQEAGVEASNLVVYEYFPNWVIYDYDLAARISVTQCQCIECGWIAVPPG